MSASDARCCDVCACAHEALSNSHATPRRASRQTDMVSLRTLVRAQIATRSRGVVGFCFPAGTRRAAELMYTVGQTTLPDADGGAGDVADGATQFHVEAG